jgi:hypothetical protein
MANDEKLKVLLRGAQAWNKWKAENPGKRIDLSLAFVRMANLRYLYTVALGSATVINSCSLH